MKEQKYTGIKIITALITGAGILRLSAMLLRDRGPEMAMAVPAYLISITVMVLLAVFFGEKDRITEFRRGWKTFFTRGWYILMVSGVFALMTAIGLSQEKEAVFSPVKFAGFAVVCLLTACFEEIWFRGIIQGILEKYGKAKFQGFWKTACITSAMFGAMHLMNLIHRPDYIIGTVTQVLYAFSLGMILSMILYSGGNIGVAILLHAVFNFSGSLSEVFVRQAGTQAGDMPIASAVFILVLMMPGVIYARRTYKKIEREPVFARKRFG